MVLCARRGAAPRARRPVLAPARPAPLVILLLSSSSSLLLLLLLLLHSFVAAPAYAAELDGTSGWNSQEIPGEYGASAPNGKYSLQPSSPSVVAYQYVIVVGVFAVIAVLVPLHAILPQAGRLVWHTLALIAALASGIAAIIGATFASSLDPSNGTIWQSIPTAALMLFLAFLIQVQVVGGWHVVRLRARARGRILLTILEDGHWRDDVSADEYARLVAASGLSSNLLRFGAEPDQDAAVVSILPTMKRWARTTGSGSSGKFDVAAGASGMFEGHADLSGRLHTRHEPSGLVILGSVRYASLWLEDLLNAVRNQSRSSLAYVHHVCIFLWWVGMMAGALSKTGFNAVKDAPDLSAGVKNLRTSGIWIEALLLVIGMYAFPYTRSIARYGTRIWPRMALLGFQTLASFSVGVAMLAVVRQESRNQNLIAYAVSLMVAATACALWCIFSVEAYRHAIRILLSRNPLVDRKATAFIAAVITRPRQGYQGNTPVLRWGDLDETGHAALEVVLDHNVEVPIEDAIEERLFDDEAGVEWRQLESAAKHRVF
jgi:hypothetical protein